MTKSKGMMEMISLVLFLLALPLARAAPQIRVTPATVDFGQARPGQVFDRELFVVNTGTDDLKIQDMSSSCSLCLHVSMEQRIIKPGGQASVRITYRALSSSAVQARQSASLVIRSNDPKRPKVEIAVSVAVHTPKTVAEAVPQSLLQAARGRYVPLAEWNRMVEKVPAEAKTLSPFLKKLIENWPDAPRFQPIPDDGVILPPRAIDGTNGGKAFSRSSSSPRKSFEKTHRQDTGATRTQETIAKRITEGAPRLVRLLRRDFPDISPEAVKQLKNLPADAPKEVRWTVVNLLAELAMSESNSSEAAKHFQTLFDVDQFPDTFLAVEASYPPFTSDAGWHAARRLWRLGQLYTLLGQDDHVLAVATKALEQFRGTRWIRWADLLLPLAAKWSNQGKENKATEVYQTMVRLMPAGYEQKTAMSRLKALDEVTSRSKP